MPIFRREFTVHAGVKTVTLRLAGLGQWQASLDGKPLITKPGLHQDWTNYRRRVTFTTLQLPALTAGRHVLGVMLGNGMYNVQKTAGRYTKLEGSFGQPKLTAEVLVTYRTGKPQRLATDAAWQAAPGPVTFSSIYGGEDFDARRVAAGWDRPGFTPDQAWQPAQLVEGPGGIVQPGVTPDVVLLKSWPVVHRSEPAPGKIVFDFGQNLAGIPSIDAEGPAGAVLRLTPGELLKPDGTVSQASSGGPMWWSYTLHGGGPEHWQPGFGYYGFRYIQAEWTTPAAAQSQAKLTGITAEQLSADAPVTGTFASSSELLNGIHHLIVEAMRNNEVSLFTDCPHREKLGWLEQDHLVAGGLMFNNDLEGLFRETSRNIEEAQGDDGMVPTIAPQYTKFGPKYPVYDDSPEWAAATVLAPWKAFAFYGDVRDLDRAYPAMQLWLRYLQGRAHDGIVEYGLGDWYDVGPGAPGFEKNTTLGVTGTLMLYECAETMARIAGQLNRRDDEARYLQIAEQTAKAFDQRFWDPKHGWYDTGSQTANAMPLALGIVPAERRPGVLQHILDDLHAHGDHATTGEVGYPYLLRALSQADRNDVVLAMLLRRDSPSYGAQIAAGATSLTEAWDANPKNSQDHFMLGGAEEWLYRSLAGIDIDLSRQDVKSRLTLRPVAPVELDWVRCRFLSRLGPIESDWRRQNGVVTYRLTVPHGTEATVILQGHPRQRTPAGAIVESSAEHQSTFQLRAGTWRFQMAD